MLDDALCDFRSNCLFGRTVLSFEPTHSHDGHNKLLEEMGFDGDGIGIDAHFISG